MIKAQDVLALLKLISIDKDHWTYRDLSYVLRLSVSQLHYAVERLSIAKLVINTDSIVVPNIRNTEEFLIHGVKYVFPAEKGEVTRGIPTAHSAPPLNAQVVSSKADLPVVWPDPEGDTRGISFSPIHKYAVIAAQRDKGLYEFLTLVDAIRGGNAREQNLACKELSVRLNQYQGP